MLRLAFLSAFADALLVQDRPITKIVKLLRSMEDKLEEDQRNDDTQWKKFQCWCDKNNKEYSEAAKQAQDEIKMREARAQHNTALAASSKQEIENFKEEKATTEEDLNKYREQRQKEMEDYQKSATEMTQAISQMKAAITVLQKHQGGGQALVTVTNMLKSNIPQKHQNLLQPLLDMESSPEGKAFLEQSPAHTQDYQSQSSGIFGILSQMLETFESDLKEAQEQEATNKSTGEKIISAKTKEIEALEKQIATKTQVNAQAMVDATDDAGVAEKIRLTMAHDIKFLQEVKEKCPKAEEAYQERLKGRQAEIEAIGEAIEILAGDNAQDLFSKTVPGAPSFLQVATDMGIKVTPKVALMMSKVQLDGFARVKKEVQKLIDDLEGEQSQEQKDYDQCNEDKNNGDKDLMRAEEERSGLESRIELKTTKLDEAKKDLDAAREEKANQEKELEQMTTMRAEETAEFQKAIQDQRDTKDLLQKAIQVLQKVYENKAAFLQQDPDRHPDAPEMFGASEKNASGGNVVAQLQHVYDGCKKEIALLDKTEVEAQQEFLKMKDQKNTAIADAKSLIVKFETQNASDEEGIVLLKKELQTKVQEIGDQMKENDAIENRCSFLVKNFTIRQQYRRDEMDALREVMAMLSGKDLQQAMANAGAGF